ncbi:unnamed protein product [Soboliphyme baturini]|uniref:Vinculin n=1 Tax=Soboliphyme baturini TaxID=241478 RepID=A0A183IRU5_9BILA|nr:unnamed protein product [Soboliphyme baturini]
MANRDLNFSNKAHNLQDHSLRCAETGRMVGTAGTCKNKKAVEALCSAANQVANMTPQVINAGKIRFHYPDNQSADEHFENLRREFADALQRLRVLVDDAVDRGDFIKASDVYILPYMCSQYFIENLMRHHAHECDDAIRNCQPQKMVDNTSSIARLANRVLMAAKNEADNSEDPLFVGKIKQAADRLQAGMTPLPIPPMVNDAKQIALNPRDQYAGNRWKDSNRALLDAVGQVRKAILPESLPNLAGLDIGGLSSTLPRSFRWSPKPYGDSSGCFSRGMTIGVGGGDEDDDQLQMGYASDSVAPVTWTRRKKSMPAASLPKIDFRSMFDLSQFQIPQGGREFPAGPHVPAIIAKRREEVAPPRPPPPLEVRTSPRLPPPPQETDDEEEMRAFWERVPLPKANQPILSAAHSLHKEVQQWSSRENDIVAAAKRMAILMAKLSQLVRGEGGSKKDLIDCAKAIADASEEVTRLAVLLARQCTDIKMRKALLQVCERIPTIATQLKILSTVKATMLGSQGKIYILVAVDC